MKNVLKLMILVAGLLVLAISCSKTLYVAYTPTEIDVQNSGASLENLTKGQTIYSTSCTKCHSIDPPEKYTKAEWDKILPRMSKKAKLTASDSEILGVYIFARAKEVASK